MRQRLALATALLGDPRVLVLDEPANGLDPDGIRWLRGFFRYLADQGRTVLISSHQLGEVQETADRVVILHRGRLVQAGAIAELTAGTDTVTVRSPQAAAFATALAAERIPVQQMDPGTLVLRGVPTEHVGHLAFVHGIELHELSRRRADLEELFFALTEQAQAAPSPTGPAR
jgi:ABC-2 type transport system ATP-binding protein